MAESAEAIYHPIPRHQRASAHLLPAMAWGSLRRRMVDKIEGFLYPKLEMAVSSLVPPSFSLLKKSKTYLLLKDQYRDLLIGQGIEDIKSYLKKYLPTARYLTGRTLHPSFPLGDGKRMVLRQYSHGGLFRFLTRDLYLFGSRSFRELSLTEEIRSCGIPTIQPVGAIHRFLLPPVYKAYLLSMEIPDALDLIKYFQQIGNRPSPETLLTKRKIIRKTGRLLWYFHQAGFFHGDLQLKNILVEGEQTLLIDFDRSYRKPTISTRKRMKNLLRLNRSAEKWKRLGLPITRTDCWRFFLAYAGEDLEIRAAMKKVMRGYSFRSFFYRLGWAFENIVRSLEFGVKKLQTKYTVIRTAHSSSF